MTNKQNVSTRYIPVSKFNDHYPWPSPQSIRNRIHAAKRGNDPEFLHCIKIIGGRVLVDESEFQAWLTRNATPA